MAKKQAAAELSIWKPEESGEFLEGKFKQYQDTSIGMFCILSTGVVAITTILRKLFIPIYADIKPGDLIKVTYTGKAGRAKNFKLEWKGKEIKPAFDITEPASKESVDDFFSDGFQFPAQGEKKAGWKPKK